MSTRDEPENWMGATRPATMVARRGHGSSEWEFHVFFVHADAERFAAAQRPHATVLVQPVLVVPD